MFISKNLVYLELHKTGSTHICNILKDILDGEQVGKHNQASSDLISEGRNILGSIRDPWEWYTSLWAYGCDNKGAVFWQVTNKGIKFRGLYWKSRPYAALLTLLASLTIDHRRWKDTYKDVNDAEAFRTWLHMIHDKKYMYDIGEGYGPCSLSRIAGLLTYRYVKLFCTQDDELTNLNDLSTFDQLADYETKYCFIDRFVRNESLESDLFHALDDFGFKISNHIKSEIVSRQKTNISSRKYGPKYYYDSESENLIAEREKLIIQKFGYVAPSLRN